MSYSNKIYSSGGPGGLDERILVQSRGAMALLAVIRHGVRTPIGALSV